MIVHHPRDEMIVEYAAGSLAPAESLLVASHAALCADCRASVGDFETIGAALLDGGDAAEVGSDALAAVLKRIDALSSEGAAAVVETPAEFDSETLRLVPPPARALLDRSLSALDWRRIGRGLRRASMPSYGGARVSLVDIEAGRSVPTHTHSGYEYTLVLTGTFRDGDSEFSRGDVAIADQTVTHKPGATAGENCLCLTIEEGPVRLTGPVGRLLNPLIKG